MRALNFILSFFIFFSLISCSEKNSTEKSHPTNETEKEISKKSIADETTITCTCTDSDGKTYRITETCPIDGYCDCRNAKKPKVVCCLSPCVGLSNNEDIKFAIEKSITDLDLKMTRKWCCQSHGLHPSTSCNLTERRFSNWNECYRYNREYLKNNPGHACGCR